MRVVRIEKQVYLQARSEEALARRIGTFARALQLRSGNIVALERRLLAEHGRAALIRYELPLETLRADTLPGDAQAINTLAAAS